MKRELVIKVLNRYAKGLNAMQLEALSDDMPKDAERYRFDARALEQAINIIKKEEGVNA